MQPYDVRYAMTNVGAVVMRTRRPVTAAKARRILASDGIQVTRWVRLRDMLGWREITITVEN